MTRLRIALLNAAHDGDYTRRNFRREVDADLVEYHAPTGNLPETFAFDAFIVTGSRASVYWDEEWIHNLKDWVGAALERDLPALGVCYGHQLLADVLDGEVECMDEYEIGYREVHQIQPSRLFEGVDEEFTVFTTHSDRVTRLPPGATLLAENDYGIHAFRAGTAFSVQFHPEYDMETAESVTLDKEDQLSQETLDRVLEGISADNYANACEAKTLFDNFTEFVRDHASDDGETQPATSD